MLRPMSHGFSSDSLSPNTFHSNMPLPYDCRPWLWLKTRHRMTERSENGTVEREKKINFNYNVVVPVIDEFICSSLANNASASTNQTGTNADRKIIDLRATPVNFIIGRYTEKNPRRKWHNQTKEANTHNFDSCTIFFFRFHHNVTHTDIKCVWSGRCLHYRSHSILSVVGNLNQIRLRREKEGKFSTENLNLGSRVVQIDCDTITDTNRCTLGAPVFIGWHRDINAMTHMRLNVCSCNDITHTRTLCDSNDSGSRTCTGICCRKNVASAN